MSAIVVMHISCSMLCATAALHSAQAMLLQQLGSLLPAAAAAAVGHHTRSRGTGIRSPSAPAMQQSQHLAHAEQLRTFHQRRERRRVQGGLLRPAMCSHTAANA